MSKTSEYLIFFVKFPFLCSTRQTPYKHRPLIHSTVPFLCRLNALVAICLLQAWLMWNFINFHLRRKRENRASGGGAAGGVVTRSKNKQQAQAQKRKEKRANDDLPEVDQNTSLRQRNK